MTNTMSRRLLTTGLGLCAGVALTKGVVNAQVVDGKPLEHPWTGGGALQRAGGKLSYVTIGSDPSRQPPILLLHKLGGWVADWRFVALALAEGRRVIAFDLPGHGNSAWQGPPPYIQSLGETASLLVGALDEMGIAQVDIIGNSLGGCLSIPLAAFWKERVRRLVLVSCAMGSGLTLSEIRDQINKPGKVFFYSASGEPLPNDDQMLIKVFGTVHPEQITMELNASRRRAGLWVQPSERGVAIADLKNTLKRVDAPTMLLYGSNNTNYLKYRAGAEAALKHSVTKFVPNAGAFVQQDNPEGTAKILVDYVT